MLLLSLDREDEVSEARNGMKRVNRQRSFAVYSSRELKVTKVENKQKSTVI